MYKQDDNIKRVNIGCGQSPTAGYFNCDNSFTVWISRHPILAFSLDKVGILDDNRKRFISIAKNSGIVWIDATKPIPFPANSVDVLYSSHMVEHLDQHRVTMFLKKAHRVLSPNGIIRIVVPDLQKLVSQYISDGDADKFIERTRLAQRKEMTVTEKVKYLAIGHRKHQWMYDGASMIRLLSSMGFNNVHIMPAGSTMIPDPGELNLYERQDESIYVEACKT